MVQKSNYWFLQFSFAVTDNETNKLKNSWVREYRSFWDPFVDKTLWVYVPMMYILMTAKTHWLYCHALHWVIVYTQCMLDPFSVTYNFEKPFHVAVQEKFKRVILNGCLFRWKDSLRREMKAKEIGIRDEQVSMAMTKHVIDILTIIPHIDISKKGIPFVRSILESNLGAEYLKKWGNSGNISTFI